MSSDPEKLKEEAARKLEAEELRKQQAEALRLKVEEARELARNSYDEARERARAASEEGRRIAQEAAERGAKLGEKQAKEAYEAATYLQLPSSKSAPSSAAPLTSIATPRLPVYYVIVGRGPQSIIDHTTLRQTAWGKARIAGLPVLHIGFANPWTKYMEHGMGQPPYLLNLPGFGSHPLADRTVDSGLNSREFAESVEAEYGRLKRKYGAKVDVKEMWVVWIQSTAKEPLDGELETMLTAEGISAELVTEMKSKLATDFAATTSPAYYRLLLLKPKPADLLDSDLAALELVYASYVDICTGPGRPNVFPPSITPESADYKKARTVPWLPVEKWDAEWGDSLKTRKILNGVESIRDEVTWTAGQRVCVTAGGGVGLNAAERARNVGCWLDWFGQTSLMPTFDNPRNDTILKHPTEARHLEPGERTTLANPMDSDDKLIPCSKEMRLGRAAKLAAAALSSDKVDVTLVQSAREAAKIRDFYQKSAALHGGGYWNFSPEYAEVYKAPPSKLYDRLVVPNGQATKALGHAYYFARHLGLNPLNSTAYDRMVGLASGDNRVRVLGGAAHMYEGIPVTAVSSLEGKVAPVKKMWTFRLSLPVSSVPDGFIFSGVNIAAANHYFDDRKRNKNVNTATEEEIAEILQPTYLRENAEKLAQLIVERRNRLNGYSTIEQVILTLHSDEDAKEIHLYDSSLDDIKTKALLGTSYDLSGDEALLADE